MAAISMRSAFAPVKSFRAPLSPVPDCPNDHIEQNLDNLYADSIDRMSQIPSIDFVGDPEQWSHILRPYLIIVARQAGALPLQSGETRDDTFRQELLALSTDPVIANERVEGMTHVDGSPIETEPLLNLAVLLLPEIFDRQHERLHGHGHERASFDGDWNPYNEMALVFMQEHLQLLAIIASIGVERLGVRLPRTSSAWDQYCVQFPVGLTTQWRQQLAEARGRS